MKNFKQRGGVIALIAVAAVASGTGILVGSIFGIAQNAAAAGEEVQAVTEGVFSVNKKAGEVWAVGAKVYWNDTDKNFTTTATNNVLVGAATEAAANSATVGTVLLDGVIR